MLHQPLTPIGGSLALSALVVTLPVLTVLLLLGALRRPACPASAAGPVVDLALAILAWGLPAAMALNATRGFLFGGRRSMAALWPPPFCSRNRRGN